MPTTGLGGYRYDNSSDPADGPGQALRLAQDVARNIDPVADSTARAALVANGYAYEGMRVWQIDTQTLWLYASAQWVELPVLPHAEWTATSASVATGSGSSVGTLSADATNTNSAGGSLATISTNTLTITKDGIYDITFFGTLNGGVTGATYVSVSDGTNVFRVSNPGNTTWGGAVIAGWRLNATTVLTFTFLHTSAANRVLTSRFTLNRNGGF
jgi:hypothetical protein